MTNRSLPIHATLASRSRDAYILTVAEAVACARLGCRDFLGGPIDPDGTLTLAPSAVVAWLRHLMRSLPGCNITLETSAEDCLSCFHHIGKTSHLRPHFASVDFRLHGATRIADHMIDHGIGIEGCISDEVSAERFARYKRRRFCRRLVLQIPDTTEAEADVALTDALYNLAGLLSVHEVILQGSGRSAWHIVKRAFAGGFRVRIGMGNIQGLPDGRHAESSVELVRSASLLLSAFEDGHRLPKCVEV